MTLIRRLLILTALCSVGTSIAWATSTTSTATRGLIAFVGDSNIVRGGGPVVQDLTYGPNIFNPNHSDNNYVPVFIARAGAGLRSPDCLWDATTCPTNNFWANKLKVLARVQADAVVTELGINDALFLGTASSPGWAAYGQKIDGFMKLLPAGKPVFWTNLPCVIEPTSRQDGCAIINNALTAAHARWPNLHVINWAGVANPHPEYMDTSPADPDYRVHYSPAGYAVWAQVALNALDQQFAAP